MLKTFFKTIFEFIWAKIKAWWEEQQRIEYETQVAALKKQRESEGVAAMLEAEIRTAQESVFVPEPLPDDIFGLR